MTWNTAPNINRRESFNGARTNAAHRGISWYLTYEQWLAVWEPHWARKSNERLVMSRYWDQGAYELGNVVVATIGQNTREAQLCKRLRAKKLIM